MTKTKRRLMGILIAGLLVFLLPFAVDLPSVRTLVESRIGMIDDTRGRVESLAWHWFPLPHIKVEGFVLEHPAATLSAPSVTLYPDLWALFGGKIRVGRLSAETPELTVTSIEKLKKLLTRRKKGSGRYPSIGLTVSGGRVKVPLNGGLESLKGKIAEPEGTGLNLVIDSTPQTMRIRGALDTSFGKGFETDIRLARMADGTVDWTFDAGAKAVDLDPVRNLLMSVFPENHTVKHICGEIVQGGKAITPRFSFRGESAQWKDLNRMTISAVADRVRVHVPGTSLRVNEICGPFKIENSLLAGTDLKAALGNTKGQKLSLSLGLGKTGNDGTRPFILKGDLAADLADVPPILEEFVKVPSVQREQVNVTAVKGSAHVRLEIGNTLPHPSVHLDATDINGSCVYKRINRPIVLRGGSFRFDPERVAWTNLTGRIGQSTLEKLSGAVEIGGDNRMFDLEADIGADLSDVTDILDRVVEKKTLRAVLAQFEDVNGTAGLHVAVKNTLANPEVRIEADRIRGSFFLQRINRKMSIQGGAIRYTADGLSWAGLTGRVGPSRVDESSGTLSLTGDMNLDVSSLAGEIDTKDFYSFLVSEKTVGEPLKKKLTGISGTLLIREGAITGSVLKPETLKFNLKAESQGLVVSTPAFPWSATLVFKPIRMTRDGVWFPSCSVLADSHRFDLSGEAAFTGTGIDRMILTLKGSVPESFEPFLRENGWIPDHVFPNLPCELDPLTVRKEGGAVTVVGMIRHPDGTRTSLDIGVSGGRADIRNVTLVSGAKKAVISGVVPINDANGMIRLKFKGNLERKTLVTVLQSGESMAGDISGDFSVGYPMNPAGRISLTGFLTVSELMLDLTDGSRLTLNHGNVTGAGDQGFFELGDLVLFPAQVSGKKRPERLDIGQLMGNLTFHSNKAADLDIISGNVCGISVKGALEIPTLVMDLTFSTGTRQVPLRELGACFDIKDVILTGNLSFNARIQGTPDMLSKGTFSVKARKGVIEKDRILSKILSLADLSELFSGKSLKNLTVLGYRYDKMDIDGTITGHNIHITRGMVIGAGINFYGTGYIDLESSALDLVVLASPFKTVDRLVYHIPVIGKILGGKNKSILSFPVMVEGTLSEPTTRIFPKPISQVSSGMMDLLIDTFNIPFKLTRDLIMPDEKKSENK